MPATGTEGTTDSVAARVMKPAPVMPAAPFELSIATSSSRIWSPSDRCDVGRLGDEQRRQRHVDVGAVEVEGIAGRHDQADDRALGSRPAPSSPSGSGSAASDDEVPSTSSSSSLR